MKDSGHPTILARLEAGKILGDAPPGRIHIPSETIAVAHQTPGGAAGILRKVYAELPAMQAGGRGALVLDWPGGFGVHRLKILSTGGVDRILAKQGFRRISMIVTTNVLERMQEARDLIRDTRDVAPGFERVLVLNERNGGFVFAANSPQASAFEKLLTEHADGQIMYMPLIEGDALPHLAPSGLDMKALTNADPEKLAVGLVSDEIICNACVAHVRAFYRMTFTELSRILPFREATAP